MGQIAQKPNFGDVNRHFPAKHTKYSNCHIIEITEMDSNQNWLSDKDLQVLLWIVPTYSPQIQDGGRPPPWKIEKLPYLHKCLTDFDDIWHSDACGTSTANRPLKFGDLKSKMDFKNSLNYIGWWRLETRHVWNFVKIKFVADILRFFNFLRWRPSTPFWLRRRLFGPRTKSCWWSLSLRKIWLWSVK